MFIFGWILKFLSSSAITSVTSYLTTRANTAVQTHQADTAAAVEIVKAEVQAELFTRQAQAAMSSRHDWIVSWLGGCFVFHIFMIVLDSVFHLGWQVSALPAPMDQWEGQIVLALCCVGPAKSVAQYVANKVWK